MSSLEQRPVLLDFESRTERRQAVSPARRLRKLLAVAEMLGDLAAVIVAILSSYAIYNALHIGRRMHYSGEQLLGAAGIFAVLFIILLDRDGAYRPGNSLLRIRETERALRVSVQAMLLVFPLTFMAPHHFSRVVVCFTSATVPVFLVVAKQMFFVLVRGLHERGYAVEKVLIYGAGFTGRRVASVMMRSPRLGLSPIALVDDDEQLAGGKVFEYAYRRERFTPVVAGPVTRELIASYGADVVVLAIPSLRRDLFTRLGEIVANTGARLMFVPGNVGPNAVTEYADLDGLLLGMPAMPQEKAVYENLKRVFDFVVAACLLLGCSPLLLLVAALVKLDSKGPALFKQKRVGKDGKLFEIYKLRTMYVEAPKYGYHPKNAVDTRVTRMGRFLRRTSLDELPQLLNVLKGDMSLVGPRPEMPFIVEQYNERHRRRLQVVPGITGLWQLSADREFLIHENIHYDLYYIENRSFFMDVAIMFHTFLFAMRGV